MLKITSFISLIFLSLTMAMAQGYWTQLADCSPLGRDLSAGFAIGDYGYVAGGNLQSAPYTSQLMRYDPPSDTWIAKASMPVGSSAGVSFELNSKGWITTGSTQYGGLTELYNYNPTPNAWSVLTNFPGAARAGAVAFSMSGAGGYVGLGSVGTSFFNDLYEYNGISGNWIPKANFPGTGRNSCAYFTIGSKGYVVSGKGSAGFLTDVWEYDQTLDHWTQKADFPGTARISAACFSIGGLGFIMGGEDHTNTLLTDFWQYNATSDTWTQQPDFPGTARKNAATFTIGAKGYVTCGNGNPTLLGDLWSWTPSGVGIQPAIDVASADLYPNPGNGLFSLKINGLTKQNVTLHVTDICGREIYKELLTNTLTNSSYTIDLTSLAPGIYFLAIPCPEQNILQKIQIIR
ncbi:MAG: T9SS type A sorting domain-containing protein [Bacteroidetes bacterium]|nr:T9SS type A sorting domain-containing protein [Bacteroidota bacterium]